MLVDDQRELIKPLEVLMKRYLGVVAAAALVAGTVAVATDALAAGHGGGLGSRHSMHRWHRFAHAATMPYGPEYGDGRAIGAIANQSQQHEHSSRAEAIRN